MNRSVVDSSIIVEIFFFVDIKNVKVRMKLGESNII